MTIKTKPDKRPGRPSSTDRFKALGAIRTASLPVFSSANVVTVADEDHPAHGQAQAFRYSRDNPDIQALMEAIRLRGVTKPPTASRIDALNMECVFVSAGNRTAMAHRYLVQDGQKDDKGVPILDELPVKVVMGDSLETFLACYRGDNLNQRPDDCVTKAQQMAAALAGNPPSVQPLGEEQVCEEFQVSRAYLRKVTDPKTGLVALSPACQESIATGASSEAQGLALAECDPDGPRKVRHATMDIFLAAIGERAKASHKTSPALIRSWTKAGKIIEPEKAAKGAALSPVKLRRLREEFKVNREFDDLSAAALLAVLLDGDTDLIPRRSVDSLRAILTERAKPGPKSRAEVR